MRILFIGLGSAGQRHAKLLADKRFSEHRLFALRTHKGALPIADELKGAVTGLHSWDEVLRVKPHCAFICSPPSFHIETAIKCAERDMALFIEKPLDTTTERLGELLTLVEQRNLATYVAYNLRFSPIVQELRREIRQNGATTYRASITDTSYLPSWKPNHKETYLAHIGACLDLSHNIDLAVYLFGRAESITGSVDRLSDVTVDADDCVNMVVRHTSGVVSNIHINTLSRETGRHIVMDLDRPPYQIIKNLLRNLDKSYVAQLDYFFGNLTNPRMMNCLHDAAGLFGQLLQFKAGYSR